jgi:hypothetical protein
MRISDCGFKRNDGSSFSIRIPQSSGFAEAAAINYNPTRKENEGAPEISASDNSISTVQ